MPDDGTNVEVKEVHIPPDISRKDLEEHRKETEALIRSLKDELTELHSGDKAEREELKQQLAEANAYIAELKKAEEEREKIKSSSHTMVLPPEDIPPRQPNVDTNQQQNTSGNSEQPKRRLRGW